ncbi:MAG: tyrosine-type recombinase/integrase [Pseudolabrys sp.]
MCLVRQRNVRMGRRQCWSIEPLLNATRAGEAAGFPFLVHSHMLRHSCGYKLANDGQDTRAIQHYLGHKSINSTVRYTALAPDRFKGFWKD